MLCVRAWHVGEFRGFTCWWLIGADGVAGSIEAAKAIFDLARFPSNADMVCDQCGSRQKNRGEAGGS